MKRLHGLLFIAFQVLIVHHGPRRIQTPTKKLQVRHPHVLPGTGGPASRARAVRHPLFVFRESRCLAALFPLLAICCLPSVWFFAIRWRLLSLRSTAQVNTRPKTSQHREALDINNKLFKVPVRYTSNLRHDQQKCDDFGKVIVDDMRKSSEIRFSLVNQAPGEVFEKLTGHKFST